MFDSLFHAQITFSQSFFLPSLFFNLTYTDLSNIILSISHLWLYWNFEWCYHYGGEQWYCILVSSFLFSILLSFFHRFTICVPSCWAPEHYHFSPYLLPSLSLSPWCRSHYISCHDHDNIIRPVLGDWRLGWRRRVVKEDFGYMLGFLLLIYGFSLFCHVIFGESWIYYLTKNLWYNSIENAKSFWNFACLKKLILPVKNIGLMQSSLRWWKIDLVGVIERICSWRQWQKEKKNY